MLFSLLTVSSIATLGLWANFASAAALRHPIRDSVPFDGQYISPSSSNDAVEWWYVQAIAEPVGDEPPVNLIVLYYQGYPIASGPPTSGDPEYYIAISGVLPNGTSFSYTLPADSGSVTASGQEISGTWGSVGSFKTSAGLDSFDASFSGQGIEGSLTFTGSAAHHFGCNTTSSAYFESAIPSGATLNSAENILYNQLGWSTTIPGGQANVSFSINGTSFTFTGNAYHDANWLPAPLNDVVSSWYFLNAQVGPYHVSDVLVTPINSTRQLGTGYLSADDVVLQNQCSVVGAKTTDISTVTPFGEVHDSVSNVTLPAGFVIDYTLGNGDKYSFNLTARAQNPDQAIYHRWVGSATGGKVGGEQYTGTTLFEWLNPGMNVYNPSQ
ncbi:hypothetical protein B0H21DRAFT_571721 [Amylocystis lapponica]|nr:hypothetical protein B0H21DRAFT_571721 [Amylocystis lapponica]